MKKNRLRIDKDDNKKMFNTDSELTVEVYDLQLYRYRVGTGNASQFYYKSKLNVLNFTVHNLKNAVRVPRPIVQHVCLLSALSFF